MQRVRHFMNVIQQEHSQGLALQARHSRLMASLVKHIAYVAYPSSDVAATRAWYEEKLGLVFAGAYHEDGVEKYNEAHLGDSAFTLMAAEWVERKPGSGAGVVFEVDDVEAVAASLEANGVRIISGLRWTGV